MAINKISKFNLSLFYFGKTPFVSGLIFSDLWKVVLIVFSFPTLLARATYMSYGGGGGGSNGLVSPHINRPHPWGGGGEGTRGGLFFGHPHL